MENDNDIFFVTEKENSNDFQLKGQVDKKKKIFRWEAFLMPLLAIILGIFYLSRLSLFLFWHPILNSLIKIIYFPFFIFSEEVTNNIFIAYGTHVAVPNPLTVGLAILISLGIIYIFSRLVIYIAEKLNLIGASYIANIATLLMLMVMASWLSSFEIKSCILNKEENKNWPARDGLISMLVPIEAGDSFEEAKENLIPFYELNKVKYLYDGVGSDMVVLITDNEKELETACRLEENPHISSVWPVSISQFFGTKLWKEKRNIICEENKFSPENIKECTEFILKNRKKSPYELEYEITEDGELNYIHNLPNNEVRQLPVQQGF